MDDVAVADGNREAVPRAQQNGTDIAQIRLPDPGRAAQHLHLQEKIPENKLLRCGSQHHGLPELGAGADIQPENLEA